MISHINFHGLPGLELNTGSLKLIAPLSFGPRILHFGTSEGQNLLIEFDREKGMGPGGEFYLRGGHRLWHAPEHPERTYQPDNVAPELELSGDTHFALHQEREAATGIRKTLRVKLCGDQAVALEHELTNEGPWPIVLAPWGLTMFRPGGRGVIPLPPKGEHPRDLLPEYALVPWPYTDFSAGGWTFLPSFIGLDTREVRSPQKLGISGYPGWLAYWLNGETFIKQASFDSSVSYPDFGSKAEVFSDGKMIELETLGALVPLQPGESVQHREYWGILSDLPEPVDEAAVKDRWLPAIESWCSGLPTGSKAKK